MLRAVHHLRAGDPRAGSLPCLPCHDRLRWHAGRGHRHNNTRQRQVENARRQRLSGGLGGGVRARNRQTAPAVPPAPCLGRARLRRGCTGSGSAAAGQRRPVWKTRLPTIDSEELCVHRRQQPFLARRGNAWSPRAGMQTDRDDAIVLMPVTFGSPRRATPGHPRSENPCEVWLKHR